MLEHIKNPELYGGAHEYRDIYLNLRDKDISTKSKNKIVLLFRLQHVKLYQALTSIPAYRDTPYNETNRRYFELKRYKIYERF